jgi:hypothetical protein
MDIQSTQGDSEGKVNVLGGDSIGKCEKKNSHDQTPGNYPEENIQHLKHGESLKSRTRLLTLKWYQDTAV